MGVFCPKIMRYLAIILMVSIFIHGSSQMPNDQVSNIAGKLLDKKHGTDLNENLAAHLTKDDKASIQDGLSKLLEIFKDGDKDSWALKSKANAAEIGSRSIMDAEGSLGEKSQSRESTELNAETDDEDSDNKVIAQHPKFKKDRNQESSNAFRLWKEQKEKRVASSRSLSSDSSKCPDGYYFGIQGDVEQAGLISLSTGHNIPADRERCAEICNHNFRCKSFFYSPTVGECKISPELLPSCPVYKDWIMCTKSDASCSKGYTYKVGSVDGDRATLVEAPSMIDSTGMTDGQTDEECKIACDLDQACKSFEYSTKKQKCLKRILGKPRNNSDVFEDFEWCSKNPCKTTDGPVVNKECVFPFIWRGKQYETCTNLGRSNKGRFWCPTSTGDINVDQNSKTWGFCSDDCPQHEDHCYAISGPGVGKDCIFPFLDRGITYNRCARSHPLGSPQWCKTDKKEALTESFKSFGICHSGCDSVKECSWEKLGGDGMVAKTEGNTVASHHSKTLDECKDLCDLNLECKSFSFTQEGGICKLKDRILRRDSGIKHVPGTSTYYEPAACHDDDGNTVLAGHLSVAAERTVAQGMKRHISDSESEYFGVGDTPGSGSKDTANEMRGSYRTGGGNDAGRIGRGYRSGSDDSYKGFAGSDVLDTDNIVREVGENYGTSLEGIAHGNEGSHGSSVGDDGRGMRDGSVSVSRTGNKGVAKAKQTFSKKQAKIWDDVLQHQKLLQKLDDFHNGNV